MQLVALKTVTILVIAAAGVVVSASGEDRGNRVDAIRILVEREAAPDLWWVVPLDAKWSKFDFFKIRGDPKASVFRMLKSAKFSQTAGNFLVLDAPFDYCDKKGQGFLVLADPRGKDLIGLRFRAIATDTQTLEFVILQKFNPVGKEIKYQFNSGLKGISVNDDFQSILLSFRENESSAKSNAKTQNK